MIEKVKEQVRKLLGQDNSGHGMDHIERVLNLTLKFAKSEGANTEVSALIALLHDVDDYKLFGTENAKNLTNARRILELANIETSVQERVLSEVARIGYSKRLNGIVPKTIEGKIVSDADMCDGLGADGIIRAQTYSIKKGKPFFDKNIFPIESMNAEEYVNQKCSDSTVCHIFEKILKLKKLMLTDSGRAEAEPRQQITIDFLYHLFEEECAPDWKDYLDKYLKNL